MTEEQLITALNNHQEDLETTQNLLASLNDSIQDLEEDIERLSTAIEHWEVVNTARDPEDIANLHLEEGEAPWWNISEYETTQERIEALKRQDPNHDGLTEPVEGAFTAAEAMGNGEGDDDLLGLLEEHYAGHEVPVELEEMNGKIYIEPQGFVGEDTFMALFGGNERVKYDSEAPQGKQNWIRREDVRGYIRETST